MRLNSSRGSGWLCMVLIRRRAPPLRRAGPGEILLLDDAYPRGGGRAEGRELPPAGPAGRGARRRDRRRRRRRARHAPGGTGLRPGGPGRHAAQARRLRCPEDPPPAPRPDPRPLPHRAGRGVRQGGGPRPRRGRLPDQAVRLRGVPRAGAGALAPGHRPARAGPQAGRPHARPGHAHGHPRRPSHHAHHARVCPARVLPPERRPRAEPAHDRPARVGARLRSREQHHRRVRRLRPAQDRRRRRAPAAPHGARRRLHAERGGVTLGLAPLSIRTRLTLWYTAILLGILIVTSVIGYSLLRWSLVQDLDASLLTVAQVLRDTSVSRAGEAEAETLLRDLLGPEFYDKFFQLFDPEGRPEAWSSRRRSQALRLSPAARANAARGLKTFETIRAGGSDDVRLLTMPIIRGGRVTQIVQVGMSLDRARSALRRYLDTLVVLIPLAVALAAAGGAIIARTALRPVDEMTLAARRIIAEDLRHRIALRGIGDELRTQLTALKGVIEVSLRAARSAEEHRRVLVSSLEEVDRLIRLAEDLLLLSRSAAGPETPRGPVEMEPLLLD